jgi:type II secretory pathway component GspD/PulD (secretin)
MTMTCNARRRVVFLGVALVAVLMGQGAWGQTTETAAAPRQENPRPYVDPRPMQTFYLTNISSPNDANEIVIAIRNIMPGDIKVYLVPSRDAIVMRGSAAQLAEAQKIINDLDRAKKSYRLTYTIAEIDGGKRVGVQHFAMIVTEGQRTVMKQGSKVPVVTGSYNNASSQAESQVTFIDVGMNFDATVDPYANGARLKSKVEQLGIAEEKSGVGPQDPIVRQTAVEGTVFLTAGKPVVLGSLDVPGSTRHVDVDVMMEPLS